MLQQDINANPIIIIGAARSGTNMLRNVIVKLNGVETWPCDEINYIWRYGNRDAETDEFNEQHANDSVKKYIRSQFKSFVQKSALQQYEPSERFVLEKTCANTLRVPFVDAIVPEARYVHIVRDGRDVVSSAEKRWKAPLNIPYLMAKARYVPLKDIPYYGYNYLKNRVSKIFDKESALSVWGPKFDGMQSLSRDHDVNVVCAHQWCKSVQSAHAAFERMGADKVLHIKYEEFVHKPVEHLTRISAFMGLQVSQEEIKTACDGVRVSSVGKSKEDSKQPASKVHSVLAPCLALYNYI